MRKSISVVQVTNSFVSHPGSHKELIVCMIPGLVLNSVLHIPYELYINLITIEIEANRK